MPPNVTSSSGKPRKQHTKKEKPAISTTKRLREEKRSKDIQTVEELGKRALELAQTVSKEGSTDLKLFTEMPISTPTLEGLKRANYLEMTEIQRKALPFALAKRDVLGAAKTGSGKTLAFLIPLLENLYRMRWTHMDGLGALVISPTRELAMQIFEVLCKIGRQHKFSAGLIIGGKRVEEEKEILVKMNILICTPGRLLQHMDETVGFDCSNLQVLVLDEADRILDMGFKKCMNAIVANLPKQRQTLLFSATQTKSVKDLARLSLERPEYVGVHEKDRFSTPARLAQHYMVVDLPKKLDMLYSFIKTHLSAKTIVFMSSGKQVRFVYETFCKIQPGTPLLHLHGKQKQMKRVEIFERFMRMNKAVMFCTDIAARGLDFPAVDWVVQLDCPEDCHTYLHRVGRTARYEAAGKGLLFLLPSEAPEMVRLMEEKNIPIKEISPKSSKIMSVTKQLQHFCFQDPEIKYLGQRAFVTYVRSTFLQKNKKVFSIEALPLEEFAESLGLPGAPNIKFVKKTKNVSYDAENQDMTPAERDAKRRSNMDEIMRENDSAAPTAAASTEKESKTRMDKLFARKNAGVLADHYQKMVDHSIDKPDTADSDDEGDFITLKRADHALSGSDDESDENESASDSDSEADEDEDASGQGDDGKKQDGQAVVKTIAINPATGMPVVIPNIPADQMSKRQLRKVKEKILKNTRNTKVVFDDEGNARPIYELQDEESFRKEGDINKLVDDFQQRNRALMEEADVGDQVVDRQKKRDKLEAKKLRQKQEAERLLAERNGTVAVLGTASDDEDESSDGSIGGASEDDDSESEESDSEESDSDVEMKEMDDRSRKPTKRAFEQDSDDESSDDAKSRYHKSRDQRNRNRIVEVDDSAMTLEDQEQLALRLLGGN
ncbi:ATP-dependent RNA helicase dbp4 [Coemansia sp. Benny D115]|nr:ATP-dependent RNA helicase dbp4 [Coemansia sp. Benny D115]